MQVHGLSYANKASVQVNNSVWIPLNNLTAQVAGVGKNYGGIGGMFATLKFLVNVPQNAWVAGPNTIRFRFNGTDGLSMGFRVLAFNIVTKSGTMALTSGSFVQEDPNTWHPPLPTAQDIATGQSLWRTATLTESPLAVTHKLQAKCADCHTQDGRDLKYFNYSNLSIIERSKFHGLTATQGAQIASYIRSLKVPNPGRPWNPPYQPGPGLDAKPISQWAAGAGLEWVLDRDLDTLPYLFPGGIGKAAVATNKTLNMRELPIALQMLDWNRWLPTTHPKDAFGSAFINSGLNKRYNGEGTAVITWGQILRKALQASDSKQFITSSLSDNLYYWIVVDRYNFAQPGFLKSSTVWTPKLAEQVYSLAQWQVTKTWEMTQEFNLEGYGPAIFGSSAEPRTWLNGIPFMSSPFAIWIRNNSSGSLSLGTLRSQYLSNAWYHTQVILNSGNRHRVGVIPVDWPYYNGFISNLARTSQVPEPMRFVAVIMKGMEEGDNSFGLDQQRGWAPTFNADAHLLVNSDWDVCWKGTPASIKSAVLQAALATWFDKTVQFTPKQYYDSGIMHPTDLPTGGYYGSFVNRVWYMLPRYRQFGVNSTLLNQIATWAKTVWPLANWDSLSL